VQEVRGPLGPLLASLQEAGRVIDDVGVEPFRLEDYVAQFYGGAPR